MKLPKYAVMTDDDVVEACDSVEEGKAIIKNLESIYRDYHSHKPSPFTYRIVKLGKVVFKQAMGGDGKAKPTLDGLNKYIHL